MSRTCSTRAAFGSGGSAWSLANAAALDGVAARCAQDVAAILSNQPEARSAALSYAN